jgi:hypothetical protein
MVTDERSPHRSRAAHAQRYRRQSPRDSVQAAVAGGEAGSGHARRGQAVRCGDGRASGMFRHVMSGDITWGGGRLWQVDAGPR